MSIDMHKCNKRGTFGERKKERDSFGILYTGVLLSIVNIKRDIEEMRETNKN